MRRSGSLALVASLLGTSALAADRPLPPPVAPTVAKAGIERQEIRAQLPQGVDAALDASGTVEGFEQALESTRRGGATVTVSLPEASKQFHFPLSRLVAEARTIRGSYIGSCIPSRDIPTFIGLHRQGRLPVERLVSGTLALEGINEAMDALASGRAVRQVITF